MLFSRLKMIDRSVDFSLEDFEDLIRILSEAELLSQLKLVENILSVLEDWKADKIPKDAIEIPLRTMREAIVNELKELWTTELWFSPIGLETDIVKKTREEARKALEKMKEGD